ncbi:hypothetical protein KY331_02245 [Candidatus Woesearchaeota archaeon]|nr:hypothetical protein [Candidatus Woesearchaeota archaeon]
MITPKDWLSFLIGAIVAALGFLPILNRLNVGPKWFALNFPPVTVLSFIVAAAGFYLLVESVIEITNSNAIGWISFFVAVFVLIIGILPSLAKVGFGPSWFAFAWLSPFIYHLIFVIEGLFLMVAMFAMEM